MTTRYEHFLREIEEEMVEQRGIEKGKEEARIEIARNFLNNGITPDIIAKSTGLPVEQIQNLVI